MPEGVLYRARLPLPARVPVGRYVAQTFLVQNGNVVAEARREITIDKSGFARFVYVAAQRSSFLYGLTAVLIAVALGWLAGVNFRRKSASPSGGIAGLLSLFASSCATAREGPGRQG